MSDESPSPAGFSLANLTAGLLLALGAGVGGSAGYSQVTNQALYERIHELERQADRMEAAYEAQLRALNLQFSTRLDLVEERLRNLGEFRPRKAKVNRHHRR